MIPRRPTTWITDPTRFDVGNAEFKEPALYAGVRLVADTRNVVQAGWAERVVRV